MIRAFRSISLMLMICAIAAEPPPLQRYLPPANPIQHLAPAPGEYQDRHSISPSQYRGSDDQSGRGVKYEFSYRVEDAETGNDFGHRESRDGDLATGAYHVLLPDGRRQTVEYISDLEGYHPIVRYDEGRGGGGGGGIY